MKRLTLKLFATLRERAQAAEMEREFPDGTTVGEIWHSLVEQFPALRSGDHDSIAFAVNQEYVAADFRPRDHDEVAFIPPVSGGSDSTGHWPDRDRARADRCCRGRSRGGRSRGRRHGHVRRDDPARQCRAKVIRLEYEAYEPMALGEMRRLAEEAGRRFTITRIAIRHRIGVVAIGETSVAIAVSAPHRGEAFAACRFAIDRLKEVVPIWKKEYFEGGEVWIGSQTSRPPDRSDK